MSAFLSSKGLTKNITRTIRTAKSSVRSTIGLPESHQEQQHTIQSIHKTAVKTYRTDFEELLTAINYFNRKYINYEEVQSDRLKYEEIYERMRILSSDFRKLLSKLNKKFIHCKSECERLRPDLKEDFAKIARESPYAYVNTCKPLAIIDDCFEFNALFSIFEIPLKKLYHKFDRINITKIRSSIGFHITRFLENFGEFSELTGIRATKYEVRVPEGKAQVSGGKFSGATTTGDANENTMKAGGSKRTCRRLKNRRRIRRTYKK